MEVLTVEIAAYVIASRAVPNCVAVYSMLRDKIPVKSPLDDDRARAVAGAVLLYGLYCRLLELEKGPDPGEAMDRAFACLESEPGFDGELVAEWRRGYEAMCAYNVFRPNVTVLEFIGERAWHLAYPDGENLEDPAFHHYVELLVTESYGKLQERTLV